MFIQFKDANAKLVVVRKDAIKNISPLDDCTYAVHLYDDYVVISDTTAQELADKLTGGF